MDVSISYFPVAGVMQDRIYPISDYNVIIEKTSLLVADISTIEDDQIPTDNDFIYLHKVQFIANCKLPIADNVVIAFYISSEPDAGLRPLVINGLPPNHYQTSSRDKKLLIDYKSYCEICEQTEETTLSIAEYISEMKRDVVGTNTILVIGEKHYNNDGQKQFWKELDNNAVV